MTPTPDVLRRMREEMVKHVGVHTEYSLERAAYAVARDDVLARVEQAMAMLPVSGTYLSYADVFDAIARLKENDMPKPAGGAGPSHLHNPPGHSGGAAGTVATPPAAESERQQGAREMLCPQCGADTLMFCAIDHFELSRFFDVKCESCDFVDALAVYSYQQPHEVWARKRQAALGAVRAAPQGEPVAWRLILPSGRQCDWITGAPTADDLNQAKAMPGCKIDYAYSAPAPEAQQCEAADGHSNVAKRTAERCAQICDDAERQQEIDNGAANTGGAATCADEIRREFNLPQPPAGETKC